MKSRFEASPWRFHFGSRHDAKWRCWPNRSCGPLWLAVLLLAGCLAAGCRSVKVLYRDPEFSPARIAAGGLALGGVTPTEATRGYLEQDRLAEMVREQFQLRLPASHILAPSEVGAILGTNTCQRVLDSYFENSMLNLQAVALLHPLAQKARYFMLVDLRRNDVDQDARSGAAQDVYSDYDPAYQQTITSYGPFFFFASSRGVRHVWCCFLIYDLQTGKPVWLASGKARGAAGNYARSSIHPVSVSTMDPPAASDLLRKIIRRAARKLPAAHD